MNDRKRRIFGIALSFGSLGLMLLLLAGVFDAGSAAEKESEQPPNFGKRLVLKTLAVHPHDPGAYTQGLIYYGGFLYESTGKYGKSSLRKVDIKTGKVLQNTALKSSYFGEGLERIGDSLYFLTWQEGFCFVFDRETLKFQKSFRYPGEGWGLAYDGTHLILSDGTPKLRFYDPTDFSLKKSVVVTEIDSQNRERKVYDLNELEMVDGELWANLWRTDRIARIDPKSGRVLGWIDCAVFVPEEYREQHKNPDLAERVLNGIAYDKENKKLYLTGKEWSVLYEIQVGWE